MTENKIALIVYGHCLAHSVRVNTIVRSLENRIGPQKLFLIGEGKYIQDQSIIDHERFQIIEVKQISYEKLISRLRSGRLMFYESDEELEERVKDYIRVLRQLNQKIDLYIMDCPDQACAVAVDIMTDLQEIEPGSIVNITNIGWTIYRGNPIKVPAEHPIGNRIRDFFRLVGGTLQKGILAPRFLLDSLLVGINWLAKRFNICKERRYRKAFNTATQTITVCKDFILGLAESINADSFERTVEKVGEKILLPPIAFFQLKLSARRYNRVYQKIMQAEKKRRVADGSESITVSGNKYRDVRELFTGKSVGYGEALGLVLCPDLEVFEPPSAHLPSHVRYIGPLPYNYPGEISKDLQAALNLAEAQGKTIVYMSMGSTGDKDIINTILRYFESEYNSNCFLVFNTGNQEGILHNEEIRKYRSGQKGVLGSQGCYPFCVTDKLYVTDFLPGDRIIPRADVVLFHGGSTTFWQVISSTLKSIDTGNGKCPALVAVSTHMDQEDIGRIIERYGLGLHLRARNLKRDVVLSKDPLYQMHQSLHELLEQSGMCAQKLRELSTEKIAPYYDPDLVGQVAAEHIINGRFL